MSDVEISAPKRKASYTVRVGNVYFLSWIGLSLRWATEGTAREDLSADVKQLLTRLDELEAQELADRAHDGASRREAPSDNAAL